MVFDTEKIYGQNFGNGTVTPTVKIDNVNCIHCEATQDFTVVCSECPVGSPTLLTRIVSVLVDSLVSNYFVFKSSGMQNHDNHHTSDKKIMIYDIDTYIR